MEEKKGIPSEDLEQINGGVQEALLSGKIVYLCKGNGKAVDMGCPYARGLKYLTTFPPNGKCPKCGGDMYQKKIK